jgi:hypothetical protein
LSILFDTEGVSEHPTYRDFMPWIINCASVSVFGLDGGKLSDAKALEMSAQ